MKTRWIPPFLFVFLLAILPACRLAQDPNAIIAPDWSPSLAAPLIHSSFSLGEVVEAAGPIDYLGVNEEGVFYLHYQDSILHLSAEELVEIPDASFEMVEPSLSLPFPVNGIEEVVLKEGKLIYHFEQPDAPGVMVSVQSPDAQQGGQILRSNQQFVGTGTQRDTIDLSGYTFQLNNGALNLAYEAQRSDTQEEIELAGFFVELTDLKFSYAEGFFRNLHINLGADRFELALDERLKEATFQLADPSLGLIIHNSMGIPAAFEIHELSVITANQSTISLVDGNTFASRLIPYPGLGEVGQTKTGSFWLNRQNSSLVEALAQQPEVVSWDFGLEIHPPEDPNKRGFITNTGGITFELAVEVPLHGQAGSFYLADTFETDLPEISQVSEATFHLILENEIPLEAQVQAYFLDESGQVLDSLFSAAAYLLPPPPVAPTGQVLGATTQHIEIVFDEARLRTLGQTKQIAFRSRLSTAWEGQQAVRFQPDYELDIKLGIIATPGL